VESLSPSHFLRANWRKSSVSNRPVVSDSTHEKTGRFAQPTQGGYHLSGLTDEHGDYHFTGSIQYRNRIEVMAEGFSTTLCDNFLLEAMRMVVVTMKQASATSTSPACVNSDLPVNQRPSN